MSEFPLHRVGRTYTTLRDAYNSASPTKSVVDVAGIMGEMNLSAIATHLIQQVGRFVESYASDFLIDWDIVKDLALSEYPLEEPIDEVVCMGLRENGVDHNEYIMSHLVETSRPAVPCGVITLKPYYRKVFALRIQVQRPTSGVQVSSIVTVDLRDITDAIVRFNPADFDENKKLVYGG